LHTATKKEERRGKETENNGRDWKDQQRKRGEYSEKEVAKRRGGGI